MVATVVLVVVLRVAIRRLAWLAAQAATQRDLAISAGEAERRRLAADLHDGPLQDVLLLARRLDDAGDADGASMARAMGDDLRDLSADLRLPLLDDLGVGPARSEWLGGPSNTWLPSTCASNTRRSAGRSRCRTGGLQDRAEGRLATQSVSRTHDPDQVFDELPGPLDDIQDAGIDGPSSALGRETTRAGSGWAICSNAPTAWAHDSSGATHRGRHPHRSPYWPAGAGLRRDGHDQRRGDRRSPGLPRWDRGTPERSLGITVVGVGGTLDEARAILGSSSPQTSSCWMSVLARTADCGCSAASRHCAVVIFTAYDYPQYVQAALQEGAAGFVAEATTDELIEAVRRAAAGELAFRRRGRPAPLSPPGTWR